MARDTVENEKRLLFPKYFGRVVRTVHVGGISPDIKPTRILVYRLKKIDSFTIHNRKRT